MTDMPTTREEWGRAAVALPGFSWTMPWASLPDPHGRVWRRNWCPSDSGFSWTQVAGPRLRQRRPAFDAIDPDDPATAGCLLALAGAPNRFLPSVEAWIAGTHVEGITSLGRAVIADVRDQWGRWPGGEQ